MGQVCHFDSRDGRHVFDLSNSKVAGAKGLPYNNYPNDHAADVLLTLKNGCSIFLSCKFCKTGVICNIYDLSLLAVAGRFIDC